MRIFSHAALVLALALPCCALADATVSMQVGKTDILFPTDADYISVRSGAPGIFKVLESSASPSLRLVDAFYAESDVKATVMGRRPDSTIYSVQVLRDLENVDFTDAEWTSFLPGIAKSMGEVSEGDVRKEFDKAAEKRLSDATGRDARIKMGKLGKPTVYAADGGDVRFDMLLPMEVSVGNKQVKTILAAACAVTLVKGKLLYVYLFHDEIDEQTAPRLREQLDSVLKRLAAANIPAPATEPAPSGSTAERMAEPAPALAQASR